MSPSKPRGTPMKEGPSCSRKKRETCTHQRQEDIINVAAVIRQEMMDDFDSFNVAEKTARYLRLSVNTVRRSERNNRGLEYLETLDDFTRDSVRQVIYRMYHEGKHVLMDSILLAIRSAEIDFKGGKSTLTKLLKVMGFKWQKYCGRKALMEEPNICAKRICFLREYLQHMSDSIYVDFVYLDETWIFSRGTTSKIWQDNTKFTRKRQSMNDCKRFIVLHAGSRKGFVEGAELLFASKKTTGDYHGEMNGENFKIWMKNQLLISLEEPSIIVLDNAPDHSVQVEKLPTELEERGICDMAS
uniref:Uncharacterized protein n=1 Tax=Timema douglasi TaxID=61478 RepID=A0A7R8VX35_TIMDO|nr:unnamed protein product [Timema douglasi]